MVCVTGTTNSISVKSASQSPPTSISMFRYLFHFTSDRQSDLHNNKVRMEQHGKTLPLVLIKREREREREREMEGESYKLIFQICLCMTLFPLFPTFQAIFHRGIRAQTA